MQFVEKKEEKKLSQAKIIELICKTAEEMLARVLPKSKVKAKIIDHDNQETIWVNIENKENSSLLIGKLGVNLAALQHLLRLIVRRKLSESVNFIVDANKYKEDRLAYLEKLASDSAAIVVKTEKPLLLEIMPAYERRVIHLALADHDAVITESEGEGEQRRVIIKLKP